MSANVPCVILYIFQLATGKAFSYDLVESLEQYYHSRRSLGSSVDKTIREFCWDSTFDVRKLIWSLPGEPGYFLKYFF